MISLNFKNLHNSFLCKRIAYLHSNSSWTRKKQTKDQLDIQYMFPMVTGFMNCGQQIVRVARYIGPSFMITLSRVLLNSRIWVIRVDSLKNPMFGQTKNTIRNPGLGQFWVRRSNVPRALLRRRHILTPLEKTLPCFCPRSRLVSLSLTKLAH